MPFRAKRRALAKTLGHVDDEDEEEPSAADVSITYTAGAVTPEINLPHVG